MSQGKNTIPPSPIRLGSTEQPDNPTIPTDAFTGSVSEFLAFELADHLGHHRCPECPSAAVDGEDCLECGGTGVWQPAGYNWSLAAGGLSEAFSGIGEGLIAVTYFEAQRTLYGLHLSDRGMTHLTRAVEALEECGPSLLKAMLHLRLADLEVQESSADWPEEREEEKKAPTSPGRQSPHPSKDGRCFVCHGPACATGPLAVCDGETHCASVVNKLAGLKREEEGSISWSVRGLSGAPFPPLTRAEGEVVGEPNTDKAALAAEILESLRVAAGDVSPERMETIGDDLWRRLRRAQFERALQRYAASDESR